MTERTQKALVGHGLAIGLDQLEGFQFDPYRPYAGCRICGQVFQTPLDRKITPRSPHPVVVLAERMRRNWRNKHARQHTDTEHRQLALSGRYLTPDAAQRMAAYGVISIIDLALDQEVNQAYAESRAVPSDDVEGS